jgi:hypothetical protein
MHEAVWTPQNGVGVPAQSMSALHPAHTPVIALQVRLAPQSFPMQAT